MSEGREEKGRKGGREGKREGGREGGRKRGRGGRGENAVVFGVKRDSKACCQLLFSEKCRVKG